MVEEFHNGFMHVVIDCKTGNNGADKGIEMTIKAYVHMVVNAVETGRMDELIRKSRALTVEISR